MHRSPPKIWRCFRRRCCLGWLVFPSGASCDVIDVKTGLLVNARGEEAATKPTFASALRLRRCLVPATAFYEWREADRQPFAYQRPDGLPYAIGGLWDPTGAAYPSGDP